MGSRLKTPVLLQMEATECGAAALGIVLAYYGRYVSLEELREACGISRDGSKAINILKAARNYGLKAYGAKGARDAIETLRFPFIIFWRFNHFVVVEDIQKNKVYINDPATGRRNVSITEFDKSYTGIVLHLEPDNHFKRGGYPPSIIRSLKSLFLQSISAICFLILISLTLVVPGVIIPGFSKIFIDNILIKGMQSWLVLFLVALVLTYLISNLFLIVQQFNLLRLHLKLMIVGSVKMLWHVFRLPIYFFEQRYVGDITERIKANDRIATLLSDHISSSALSMGTMLFFAIVLFLYDWLLASISLIAVIINTSVLYIVSKNIKELSKKYLQDRGKLMGIETNGIRAIETLKTAGLDGVFFKKWVANHAKIIETQQKQALYNQLLSSLPALVFLLSGVLILGLGSYRIMEGLLSIGSLIAFQALFLSFNEPVNTLLGLGSKLQEIPGDIARVEDVLHQKSDVRFKNDNLAHQTKMQVQTQNTDQQEILLSIQNISFGYSKLEKPIIQNFSLSLKKGGQIALVGATGSGKSTLAKLITGLYQPWKGSIEIQNQNINEYTSKQLSEILSFVDQDIFLFEGTIRDNLSLWKNEISETALFEAVDLAFLKEVILARHRGLDAFVEEDGLNFSSGERQRLEIARALVTKPQIVILDEGTAALDAILEEKIIQNMKNAGYSLLLITHRLSAIRDSDEIIVLDKGTVVERGTHEILIAKAGHYKNLLEKVS